MEKNLIKVDFLQGGKKKFYQTINIFSICLLILHMSLLGVFFVAFDSMAGVGNIDQECQSEGFDYGIAKYQCGSTSPDEGDGSSLTVSWTDCESVDWTADPEVAGVLSKEGTSTYVHSGGSAGTIAKACQQDLSHITFCGIESEQEPVCGNGILEGEEECDDKDDNGLACQAGYGETCFYCSNSCAVIELEGPYCGDGVINGGEECDDGPEGSDTCTTECTTICCQPEHMTIKAYKIVCADEADLPNWGNGGPNIIADTATNYVNNSQGKCHLASDWSFQWGFDIKRAWPTFTISHSGRSTVTSSH